MWNLKQLRDEHGESQEDLANTLGINQGTVSACERGIYGIRVISVVIAIAQYYHVSVDYLLGLTTIRDTLTDEELQLAYRISRLDDKEFTRHLMGLLEHYEASQNTK